MALDPELKMVFEKLEKDIGVVAEVQIAHGKKLDATHEAVGQLQEDVTGLKIDVATLRSDVTELKSDMVEVKGDVRELKSDMVEVKGDVRELKSDMVEVKGQLDLIRGELKAKVDRSEFHLLEERVIRLERRALVA